MMNDTLLYPLRKTNRFSTNLLLGRYFFRTYQRVIIVSCGILLAVFLLGQVIYSLPAIIASGFNLLILFKIIICYSPQALTIILPFVLSFGVFLVTRRQFENHEMLIARGFGVSEKQLLQIAWKLGLIGFGLLLVLKCYLAPWGQRGYRDVKFLASQNIARAMLEEGRFFSPSTGFTIFIGKKTFNGALADIFILDNRNPDRTSAISAQKGAMTNNNILTLNNGIEFQVGGPRVTSLQFDRYSMDVSVFQSQKQRRSGNEMDASMAWRGMHNAVLFSPDYYYNLSLIMERIIYSLLGIFFPLFATGLLWKSNIDKSGRYGKAAALLFFLTVGFFVIHLVAYNYVRNHVERWYVMLTPGVLLWLVFLIINYFPHPTKKDDDKNAPQPA